MGERYQKAQRSQPAKGMPKKGCSSIAAFKRYIQQRSYGHYGHEVIIRRILLSLCSIIHICRFNYILYPHHPCHPNMIRFSSPPVLENHGSPAAHPDPQPMAVSPCGTSVARAEAPGPSPPCDGWDPWHRATASAAADPTEVHQNGLGGSERDLL